MDHYTFQCDHLSARTHCLAPSPDVTALLRSTLVLALMIVALILGAAHGARGLAVAGAAILAWAAKDSAAWRRGEAVLVRLTGSRRRAAIAVLGTVIVVLITVNVLQAMR